MAESALLKAVSAGRPHQASLLLDAGANVNQADDCKHTPLVRALFVDRPVVRQKLVKLLLRHGASPDTVDVTGRTALSWACMYGRMAEVSLILQHDPELNRQDDHGQTPLFYAVCSGNAATVKLVVDALIKYGLSVDVANWKGTTPLLEASRLGHDVCASILIHQGRANNHCNEACVEKWASAQPQPASKFPPILSQITMNKVKYWENKANQLRVWFVEDSDEELPAFGGSEFSSTSIETIQLDNDQPRFIASANQKGRAEQERNTLNYVQRHFHTSETRQKAKTRTAGPATRNLQKMYRLYEVQKSASYRKQIDKSATATLPLATDQNGTPSPDIEGEDEDNINSKS